MAEIIVTGGGTDSDLKQNSIKTLWENFRNLDKFSKLLVVTTSLFLVFAGTITTMVLQTRQYTTKTVGDLPTPKEYPKKFTPTKMLTPTPSKQVTKTPTPTNAKIPTPTPY